MDLDLGLFAGADSHSLLVVFAAFLGGYLGGRKLNARVRRIEMRCTANHGILPPIPEKDGS